MKKRRVKIVLTKDGKKVAACAAAVVVLLALLLFFALFKVDSVSVVGSTRYSDEEIRQMAMGSPLDSNTLLAVWLHRHQEAEDIPFVESFDLEMLDSHSIRIHVNEKEIVGYVARDGQKMYFDKDGNVVESEAQEESEILDPEAARQELETLRQEAEQQEALKEQQEEDGESQQDEENDGTGSTPVQQVQVLEPEVSTESEDGSGQSRVAVTDVPLILGVDMQNVQLGEKITVENDGIFNTILGITRMVEKYQILPESVLFDSDYNITLVYNEGKIHCQLGQDTLLEEKITRVAALLPELENLTGILHLEDYTEETVNIFFSEESLYTLKLALAEAEGILDDAESQEESADNQTGSEEDGQAADGSGSSEDSSGTQEGDSGDGSGQTDGSGSDSGQTDGSGSDSGQTDSSGSDFGQTDGSGSGFGQTDSSGTDSGQTDSAGTDGGGTADSQGEDAQTGQDGSEADSNSDAGTATGSQSGTGTGSSPGVTDLVGG